MDELHGHRSFADSGSDPFDGAMAHVADRKNTGDVRLQQEGITFKGPPLGMLPIADKIGTSQQEPALISLDQVSQPLSAWQRANKGRKATLNT